MMTLDSIVLTTMEPEVDAEFEGIKEMFYNRDSLKWVQQIDEPTFKQDRCYPPESLLIMSKVRTVV